MMGSTPASSASNPASNTMARTNIYWDVFSPSTFLKNQRAIIGNPMKTIAMNMAREMASRIQNRAFNVPSAVQVITAKINNNRVSATMVAPTEIVTAYFLTRPNMITMGERKEERQEGNEWESTERSR